MPRLSLPEIEDFAWCPPAARDAATSFLALLADLGRPYDALAPQLAAALRATGAERIVDLASGAGGPWRTLRPLVARHGADVDVLLTDRFPAAPGAGLADDDVVGAEARRVRYLPDPVDATEVPTELHGFRTVCGAFHHFPPPVARAVLEDAVRAGEGIAVLEAVRRSPPLMAAAVAQVLPYLVVAPFLRPFSWRRMLWSYPLPLAPAMLAVDGLASCLRAYAVEELRALTRGLDAYAWQVGEVRAARAPVRATYLIGVPR